MIIDNLWVTANEASFIEYSQHAQSAGLEIKLSAFTLDVISGNCIVRLAPRHQAYLYDVINDFDNYFFSVQPISVDKFIVADFSTPRFHNYKDFHLMPVYTPSLPEPVETSDDYLHFADLCQGDVAIDLGGYCGLVSILLKEKVGPAGTVLTLEPDFLNAAAAKINFELYKNLTNNHISLVNKAIWHHSEGINFSCEGNMGSAASNLMGGSRGREMKVKTITLGQLVQQNGMEKVDFIKCDVEGAECSIWDDKEFFNKFRPKIVIEPHLIDGKMTTDECMSQLKNYGYECKLAPQTGVSAAPLIYCIA